MVERLLGDACCGKFSKSALFRAWFGALAKMDVRLLVVEWLAVRTARITPTHNDRPQQFIGLSSAGVKMGLW
jgi:hypothetical protein